MQIPTVPRFLIVCTRRIGDVLLATPMARSLRQTWPNATVDMLVFRGTQGVLEGNPDIHSVITVPERSRWQERFREMRLLWRRYDTALSPVPSDRARLYAWAAGRRVLGTLAPEETRHKGRLLHAWVPFDGADTHTVSMGLRIAELAGAAPCAQVVAPSCGGNPPGIAANVNYAVLHPYPRFPYKMWTRARWEALAQALAGRGLRVMVTGGPDAEERAFATDIATVAGATSLAGQLSLGATADLLRQARVYVGPDTAVTHMAAAVGTPTVALFGPSSPVKWGPWPAQRLDLSSPWAMRGSGRNGNVFLLQGQGDCVPCLLEGCDRHIGSLSRCLQEMPVERVLAAADEMLTRDHDHPFKRF